MFLENRNYSILSRTERINMDLSSVNKNILYDILYNYKRIDKIGFKDTTNDPSGQRDSDNICNQNPQPYTIPENSNFNNYIKRRQNI